MNYDGNTIQKRNSQDSWGTRHRTDKRSNNQVCKRGFEMSKRKRKAKIRNTILKAYAGIVFGIWLLSACMLDSPSWTPTIVCAAATLLLGWFVFANVDYFQKLDEEGEF